LVSSCKIACSGPRLIPIAHMEEFGCRMSRSSKEMSDPAASEVRYSRVLHASLFFCEDLFHVGHLHTPKCILQKSDIYMIVWIDEELTEDLRGLPRKETEATALSFSVAIAPFKRLTLMTYPAHVSYQEQLLAK
jgi:hypothetical protein